MQKAKRGWSAFDIANTAFFIVLCAVFIYPIWFCVICSLTSAAEIQRDLPLLLPRGISLDAFRVVLEDDGIARYYFNTILYSVAGTAISLFLTSLAAFPFVVRDFLGKKGLNIFMVITMFVSGGLLPTYYLMVQLNLRNTIWVMLLPGAVSAYNTIIFRTFFRSIPESLREAAYIDGAGHYRVLFTIILPLSKALLATFGLFGLVGRWNDWFTPYLYLSKDELKPFTLYLRSVLCVVSFNSDTQNMLYDIHANATEQNMRCAAVLVAIIPIMCVYPFLQKYFAKGVMIGAIKE
ncbi:MAG TPA: carbohydrate ABC transporter permease [Candidatus Ornithocaccomicrobium faecavium]|uniref:Carbohydrate ABC transporter permease n=1 Tax=Candidatus Ornithocaccomicrobium faecavium TaxID=2840890 RepID=A0A9D1P8R1_9FIRM|nr:carbohydrate ABC transporter permease [Clostridiales bacterium]HIV27664.1 carbohydrate ABC transporter permease [Candidatus Ornithocaccomicrobium faecavium]